MKAQLLDESYFQYHTDAVPEPRKKKPVIVGKLVNQVKRLKGTTSKVGHYNANECPCLNEQQSKLEAQHGSRLLDKIKSHILTLDDEQQILIQEKQIATKSKRYFKKRNTANHKSENDETKRSSLFRKHKRHKQRQNPQDTNVSLLSIKHQMSEFKVPADWSCIKEDKMDDLEPFLPSQMICDVIQNINMHRLAIKAALERIELKQCEIRGFSEGISELDHKLKELVVKPDGNKRMIESVNQLMKNNSLLKQAYVRHKRTRRTIDANKSILNSTVRLKKLRAKVKVFYNNASFWSLIYRVLPLVLMVFILKLIHILL